ncbi:MAG: GatB/YqeY domain-containing protein [Chloroflexota bacterium]
MSSINDQLQAALKAAMRDHDDLRRDTLRMAISAAYNAEKAARRPLTDDEMIGVLSREVKTRRESIEAYTAAGRPDLAEKERAEAAILAEFLPAQLSEDEIRALVLDAIAQTGAASPKDLGRVMGVVSPKTKGRADGKVVSGIVNAELARVAGGG